MVTGNFLAKRSEIWHGDRQRNSEAIRAESAPVKDLQIICEELDALLAHERGPSA